MSSMKKRKLKSSNQSSSASYLNATGPVAIRLTNDYIFKRVLEKNETVLRALISSLLHLPMDAITDLQILNPIMPGDAITDRSVILDVSVEINHGTRIDIEMQVVNYGDWPERSLYYACRNYLTLVRGQDYDKVAPSRQIGFLDYTVFPDHPTFYSTYKLMDNKDHYVYTDKFSIGVVDLTKINLATKEDRLYNIDKWAQLFKATTWEDIKMLAAQDVYISKAGETYYEITADEHERQLAEAREDVLRRERATKRREENLLKELAEAREDVLRRERATKRREEKLLKELAEATQNLESTSKELEVTRLAMTEKDQRIAELEAQLAEKTK